MERANALCLGEAIVFRAMDDQLRGGPFADIAHWAVPVQPDSSAHVITLFRY